MFSENRDVYRVQPITTRFHLRPLSHFLAVFSIVLIGATSSRPADKNDLELRSLPGEFLIDKMEGRESDVISVIYTPKDRHLTDVMASVTIYYVPGPRIAVGQLWPEWLCGETKVFSNTEFRYGHIKKVELTGTARVHFLKDGEEIIKPLDFVEVKSFRQ